VTEATLEQGARCGDQSVAERDTGCDPARREQPGFGDQKREDMPRLRTDRAQDRHLAPPFVEAGEDG
jgi:hypothetical protein